MINWRSIVHKWALSLLQRAPSVLALSYIAVTTLDATHPSETCVVLSSFYALSFATVLTLSFHEVNCLLERKKQYT